MIPDRSSTSGSAQNSATPGGSGSLAAGPIGEGPKQIEYGLLTLGESLERLAAHITKLEDKVSPVVINRPFPAPVVENNPEELCAVAENLKTKWLHVESLIERIAHINRNIEL